VTDLIKLNKAQQRAVQRVAARWDVPYRTARRQHLEPSFFDDGSVVLRMDYPGGRSLWHQIETDGHCHT
jgi:hypothetical protein